MRDLITQKEKTISPRHVEWDFRFCSAHVGHREVPYSDRYFCVATVLTITVQKRLTIYLPKFKLDVECSARGCRAINPNDTSGTFRIYNAIKIRDSPD